MTSDNIYCSFVDSKGEVSLRYQQRRYDEIRMHVQTVYRHSERRMNSGKEIFIPYRKIALAIYGSVRITVSSLFNPESRSFAHYKVSDNLVSNQFNACPGYKDPDGTLFFGSINRVCFFRPEGLNHNSPTNDIHLTSRISGSSINTYNHHRTAFYRIISTAHLPFAYLTA